MHFYKRIGIAIATFVWGMIGVSCFQSYHQWLIANINFTSEPQLEKLVDITVEPPLVKNINTTEDIDSGTFNPYPSLQVSNFTHIPPGGSGCCDGRPHNGNHYSITIYRYKDGRQLKVEHSYNSYDSRNFINRVYQYLKQAHILEHGAATIINVPDIKRILFTIDNKDGERSYLIAYFYDSDVQLITAPSITIALEFESVYQRIFRSRISRNSQRNYCVNRHVNIKNRH